MKRGWGIGAGALAVLMIVTLTQSTSASWHDREYASATFTAATMHPPQNLRCSAGLLESVVFSWDPAPPPATGYVYDAEVQSGTLPGSTTSVTIDPALIGLDIGRTFTLRATGPGGWQSPPVTGSFSATRLLFLDVLTSCSVN